jgi:precorrin-6Y C5,15-methyltransferase (decarboxylating)
MTGERLAVIGIGADGRDGLGERARAFLARAEVLAGSKRQLDFFPEFAGEKLVLAGTPADWVRQLKTARQRPTGVLASGDPLFYGIGRLLLETFPKEELAFVPQVSSLALAFARIKEPWHDACVVSLHGRRLDNLLPALERREAKIALFTDAVNHPAAIARLLCDRRLADAYDVWVCENLDGPDERINCWSPAELITKTRPETFAPLNVVILLARKGLADPVDGEPERLPLLGLPDDTFRRRGELITKREIRLQALCYLELHSGDVLWDIGAGSGAVAIEAARLAPTLEVYAVEKNTEVLIHLRENLAHFSLPSIRLVEGTAPECLDSLSDPDAVFVGGNGGRLLDILERVIARLKPSGRLVLSCITLETISQAWSWLSERGLAPLATSLQIAHSRPLGKLHCLEPESPIFLLRIKKP